MRCRAAGASPDSHASHFCFASLTRISDLAAEPFDIEPVDRESWRNGDYVVAEVVNKSRIPLELASGRYTLAARGDLVVGALGRRRATLEAVGSFEDVGADLDLDALTAAGLLGRATSVSAMIPDLIHLRYHGHVERGGRPINMRDYVDDTAGQPFDRGVVLIVGTSMAAGKTTTARVIVRLLAAEGYRVVGAKLTGAGRYRDILAMKDAGAVRIFDFVDAGLPSTVCTEVRFVASMERLLSRIAAVGPDIVVAEAGASPLEPYNGAAALRLLRDNVRCTVLCAVDPYSVVGVTQAFNLLPDIVCGLATSTSAGVQLVEILSGYRALDVLDPDSRPELYEILSDRIAAERSGDSITR